MNQSMDRVRQEAENTLKGIRTKLDGLYRKHIKPSIDESQEFSSKNQDLLAAHNMVRDILNGIDGVNANDILTSGFGNLFFMHWNTDRILPICDVHYDNELKMIRYYDVNENPTVYYLNNVEDIHESAVILMKNVIEILKIVKQ